jgi:hypothetical protein
MFEGFVPDDERFAWLSDHASGWQFGEQGILVALADAIDPTGQCVEIGAGDGEGLPLTIDPFYNRGNDCVLFEADAVSLGSLLVKYPAANHRGTFNSGETVHMNAEPLLVVIDVDGIDSMIMLDVLSRQIRPTLLMVEHFDKCHPADCDLISDVPIWALGRQLKGGFTLQANAATLYHWAEHFGYTRVGTTRVNSIFVHNSHLSKVSQDVPS